jgi:hypothetical protein
MEKIMITRVDQRASIDAFGRGEAPGKSPGIWVITVIDRSDLANLSQKFRTPKERSKDGISSAEGNSPHSTPAQTARPRSPQ